MKRTSVLAVAAVLALVLAAGCDGGAKSFGEDDSGGSVTLAVGDSITIELPSNITTGYSWQVADDGGLEQSGDPVYDAPNTDAAGAGGTETFTFEATETGSGEIVLEYVRPWESVQPAETWTLDVEVE
jgi:inhibitor of cysteine peptidase